FGIVALEGAASGCVVVASDGGGLPEAAGPCGIIFESGNVENLARCLKTALEQGAPDAREHLQRHQRARIVASFERMLLEMTTPHTTS
ncbi:MAG TPA: glycosyl transferase family 1, partial [Verrucomicrobiales bacterium]|nr:glycosyl transferase family 1 [Verrucomicrobiales bacterium]